MRRLLFPLLLLAACGAADNDGTRFGFVPIESAESYYKLAYCRYATRCGVWPDVDTCFASNTGVVLTIGYVRPPPVPLVADGGVIFDGSAAARCYDALAEASCDRTDQDGRVPVPECFDVVRGTVEAGGECGDDLQCISQQCDDIVYGEERCRGTCSDGTRPAARARGESCTLSWDCTAGNTCEYGTGLDPRCAPLKPEGSACTSNEECDYGTECTFPTSTCQRRPGPGEACTHAAGVKTCRDEGTYCDPTTLVCTPFGGAGTPCPEFDSCRAPLRCDPATRLCVAQPELGETCGGFATCWREVTFCNEASGTCEARLPDGAACGHIPGGGRQCLNGSCYNGVCDLGPLCSL